MSTSLLACNEPPDLPPEDTMVLPEFQSNTNGLSGSAANTTNVSLAAVSVGTVTVALHAVLALPRAFLAGVLTAKADRDGDDWVWAKTFPLAGVEGELRGNLDGGTLNLEMYVDGLRNQEQLNHFLWFTGAHQQGSGNWTLYAPEVDSGPVLTIDWTRASDTDKTLTFTNVTADVDEQGDVIEYELKGSAASFLIHDAKNSQGTSKEFEVNWDVVDGSGRLRFEDETLCWDTVENGQVDIACP
ncbi:MAG: hypothetical protein H6729_08070 [Deltaproteobacteria bacterium]|nr:hypothetical protein [Deltaproteobacteria bacterium]